MTAVLVTPHPEEMALERFAAGDAGDDTRTIAEHLAGCAGCRSFVASLSEDDIEIEWLSEHPEPGEIIGDYEVVRFVANGGMGSVYEAVDRTLGRKIALKVLLPFVDTDAGRSRFEREAIALASLSHPNVVTLLQVGRWNGRMYMAMEWIDGVTLHKWIKKQQRSADEIVAVFLQLARGLSAAHRAGLVHRDLKPENMMVSDEGVAKLIDFGLVQKTRNLEQRLTETNTVIGTPRYMSPEQAMGLILTARSDQFSFCVTFFEALAGQHPFGGDNTKETFRAVAEGHAPSFPTDKIASRSVVDALNRGMSFKAAERFEDLDALVRAWQETPVPSAPSVPQKRQRALLPVALGCAVLLGGLLWFGFTQTNEVAPNAQASEIVALTTSTRAENKLTTSQAEAAPDDPVHASPQVAAPSPTSISPVVALGDTPERVAKPPKARADTAPSEAQLLALIAEVETSYRQTAPSLNVGALALLDEYRRRSSGAEPSQRKKIKTAVLQWRRQFIASPL
jgi:serine/threonine protein kinase